MKRSFFAALAACASLARAASPTPFTPDEHTLLLAHFDRSANADHSLGLSLAEGGALTNAGRFGGAVLLERGKTLSFAGKGNFPGNEGTIEFWIQPRWSGDDGQTRSILSAAGDGRNQININKLATGKFGIGMFGTPAGATDFVYRRADSDIRTWKAGEWHHVAVCWSGGELALWLDGKKAASRTGALPPQSTPEEIRFHGSDYLLDELRVIRVVRYTGKGVVTGQPVSARVQLGRDWRFNEPPGVYRCATTPATPLVVIPKNYLDETDPQRLPPAREPRIELFAAPGETEPATFLIVAGQPLKQVSVQVSDVGPLRRAQVTVRRVVRTPMRKVYTAKATQTEIVNRFLPRWEPLDIPAGELREVWLSFDLPEKLPAGIYTGNVTISHAAGKVAVPLKLEVLPIRLVEHPHKKLGCYYRMSRVMSDKARVLRELRDMRAHGLRNLFTGVAIRYDHDGTADFSDIREALGLLREAGFQGATAIFGSGLQSLEKTLEETAFLRAAKRAAQQFAELQRATKDFRLVLTHLDEVFGSRELLEQYIRLSKAVRQVPEVPLYITFHTRGEKAEEWRKELDPFVDLRCNHGYTFEHWLADGHTMDEYEAELRASGDEAWFYHNARGPWWTPEWSRIINGIYLWASPFTTHCPWIYQAYHENPFDDTDGPATRGHDFGLSFPGIADPADLIPTRCYEAMREGGDDLRYIATLERAIDGARGGKPQEAAGAQRCLLRWRNLIRKSGPGEPKDGLKLVVGKGGTAGESPLIHTLAERFSAEQWQQMRREFADWILRLR